MIAKINGFNMAYDDQGEGPLVILIHGFPLCREMWEKQAEDLMAAGYRVITPDLRGFGESEVTGSGYKMKGHADDIVALMDHLSIKKAVIGGMSMGGYILLRLLKYHMERLAAAIFIVTRSIDDSDEAKDRRTLLANEVTAGRPEAVADAFELTLFAPDAKDKQPEIVREVRGWMINTAPESLTGGLTAMRDRRDYTEELQSFNLPCLVIGGEMDICIPPENSNIIAEGLPDAELKIIPHIGHMANMEKPVAFNRCMLEFLKKIDLWH